MRLVISAAAEPVKPLDKPAARAAKDKPAGKVPSGENNQVHQIGRAASFLCNTGKKVPLKPVSTQTAANRLPVEIQREAKSSEIPNYTKQLGERVQGSYVIGGSPIGWNFLMWPGSKAVYYGLTKAVWLARQATK